MARLRARTSFALIMALAGTLAVTSAGPARAAGTTYYMSTGGSDANAGTSLAAPWRTFKHSLLALGAGDTLFIRGGTYSEVFDGGLTAGTAQTPITVTGYPADPPPLVKGSLTFRGATHWIISRIRVTWNGSTPNTLPLVKFMNGIGWTFKDSEVWGGHGYGTVMIGSTAAGQPADWAITGNCIHDTYAADGTYQDHNIYVNAIDYGPGLIEKNLIFNAYNGDNIKLGGGSPTARGTGYVSVRYNTMYNAAQNIVVPWKSHNNVIDHNILDYAWGKSWYPNVRGFELTGSGNGVSGNIGYKAAKLLLSDGSTTIKDSGGNTFGADPRFDSVSSCSGFHPQNPVVQAYGRYGFTPLVGDWSNHGTDSLGVAWGNKVSLRNSNTTGAADTSFTFGNVSDRFIAGDWTGSGTNDVGVIRGNTFYLRNSGLPAFQYGLSSDKVIVGDWNGHGIDDVGVVRGNTFYLRNSGVPAFQFGLSTDRVIVGDWNGDHVDTIGVIRGITAYLKNSSSSGPSDSRFDITL